MKIMGKIGRQQQIISTIQEDLELRSPQAGREKQVKGLQIVPIHFQDDLMITNQKEKELEDKKNSLSSGMWKFYILPLNIHMIGVLSVRSYVKMYNGSCNGLNPEQQVELTRLIDRHLTCFSTSPTDLGRTSPRRPLLNGF